MHAFPRVTEYLLVGEKYERWYCRMCVLITFVAVSSCPLLSQRLTFPDWGSENHLNWKRPMKVIQSNSFEIRRSYYLLLRAFFYPIFFLLSLFPPKWEVCLNMVLLSCSHPKKQLLLQPKEFVLPFMTCSSFFFRLIKYTGDQTIQLNSHTKSLMV